MDITIREILKQHIPSNEIKQRFNNKQIKLNNEVVTDLNQVLSIDPELSWDLGDFIFYNVERLTPLIQHQGILGNVRGWFGDFDTNIKKFRFLGAYDLLEFSKKDAIVFLKALPDTIKVESFTDEQEAEIAEMGIQAAIIFPEGTLHYFNELNFWVK